MANRRAVANGNWSDVATWDGGTTLPAATDDVYANNFTVNIDQDITVNSLKKISGTSITAGGSFIVTTAAAIVITAGIAAADNVTNVSYLLGVNAGSAAVSITTPTITGGAGASRQAVEVFAGYTGTLTVNANITSGTSGGSRGINSLANGGTLIVNGSMTGAADHAVIAWGTAPTVILNGNITGGVATSATGFIVASGAATVTVNGNVTGGSAGGADGIRSPITGVTMTVNGNVTGGSNTGVGINFALGSLTVRGDLRLGSYSSGSVAVLNTTGVVRYSGHAYVGGLIASTGPAGLFPIAGPWSVIADEEVTLHLFGDDGYPSAIAGGSVQLTMLGASNPAAADVRAGTVYGADGTLTGTLAVPPPASVAVAVPTDDTVGTAALSFADIAAATGAQIAAVANFISGPVTVAPVAEIRYDTDWPYSYTGRSNFGTLESDVGWEITRITLNVSPPLVQLATGAWDDRDSLTYS